MVAPARGFFRSGVTSRVLRNPLRNIFSFGLDVFFFTQYSADDENYGNYMIGRD